MNIAALNESRNAKWLALVLFIIMILTRIPFASQYLYHWDSVNMAFGIRSFDVLNGAPQFPGYIVYVALAQVVNGLFNNHQTTMVVISIISSGLSAVVLFYLGRDMFNQTTGLIAAIFLIASPLFWFYGEIALPHTLDLFAITLSAWLLYRIMIGESRWWWLAAIWLALVAGFREQDALFLAPLVIFAGYRVGVRKIIGFLIVGAVICLIWFIPLMYYSGGLQSYMAGSSSFTDSFWDTTSVLRGAGLFGLKRNIVEKLIPYTAYAWSLAAIPVLYWFAKLPSSWRAWLHNKKVWFLVLWAAPTIIFYCLIHMGQQGLVFVFFPALLLVSAQGLYRLFETRPNLLWASTGAVAVIGAGIFIFGAVYPLGPNGPKLLTYSTLRLSDQTWGDHISAVDNNFPPDTTLLLAANWRHVQYYFPGYQFAKFVLGSKFEVADGQPIGVDYVNKPVTAAQLGLDPTKEWHVIIIDDELLPFAHDPSQLQTVSLPDGTKVSYLTIQPNQAYWTDGEEFGVQPAGTT